MDLQQLRDQVKTDLAKRTQAFQQDIAAFKTQDSFTKPDSPSCSVG